MKGHIYIDKQLSGDWSNIGMFEYTMHSIVYSIVLNGGQHEFAAWLLGGHSISKNCHKHIYKNHLCINSQYSLAS